MSALRDLARGLAEPLLRIRRRNSPQARLTRALSPFLPESVCVDVGASYYPHTRWQLFLSAPRTRWVAVEPNQANLGYLAQWAWPCQVSSVTTGLSQHGGRQTLHVTHVDSGSSLLPPVILPSMRSRVRNLDYFFPVREVPIDTKTLAEVIDAQASSGPVFVKLDTQGSELAILAGAQRLLAAQRIVGIESEFTLLAQPFMQGSGKFWEACQVLEGLGFELLHVKPIYGPSRFGQAQPRGLTYLNECDAVFALRPDIAAGLPPDYRAALLAFYLSYGFHEEALALLEDDTGLAAHLTAQGCDLGALRDAIARLG